MRTMQSLLLLLLLVACSVHGEQLQPMAFRNPTLPVDQRIDDLIKRLTIEEKAAMMINHSPAVPRLGIPAYDWWNEGLHGVARAGIATVFPQAIGMAASFDAALIHSEADIISTEARVKYREAQAQNLTGRYRGLDLWSPNINIFRDPRWGRGQETYGEDPYLTATLATEFIRGLQGSDPVYYKTIATPKHFAVHSGPEPLRHVFDARPTLHDLQATYLPAFRATVQQARAASIMCSYNRIDGVPACASERLLGETLRKSWGFKGYVVSDCGAIHDVALTHKYVSDIASAAAVSVRAGTDLDCDNEYLQLPLAVKRGLITESEIDRSLRRILDARFRLGLLDDADRTPWSTLSSSENDSAEHRLAARRAAQESFVLLKNDRNLLPLRKGTRIALIGPTADSLDVLEGEYNGTPRAPITILDGLRERFPVTHAQGSTLVAELPSPVPSYQFPNGLRAEYYATPNFVDHPALVRTDASVQFDWRQASPVLGLASHGYAVRWKGTLIPSVSGKVRIGTQRGFCWDCTTPDPVRLFIDGKLVSDDSGKGKANEITLGEVTFTKGAPVEVRMEYVNTSGEGQVYLVWSPPQDQLIAEAVAAAKRADVVVMALGISAQLEGEEMPVKVAGFSGGDRTTLDLPEVQRALLHAIAATGKPTVLLLSNGSAIALHEARDQAQSIIETWYPGEEGGRAVADTLAGSSPAGRLPVTFYSSTSDLPPFDNYSMKGRTYRYIETAPDYGFGFGRSYTTFRYSIPKIRQMSQGLRCDVTVRNVGRFASDEVVQLYLSNESHPRLVAFQRIHLKRGERKRVALSVSSDWLVSIDEDGERAALKGLLSFWVGGGQQNSGLPGMRIGVEIAQ